MLSDSKIIAQAKSWFTNNPLNGNLIPNDNGKLINTNNLFNEQSLKLDDSVGIKIALSKIIEYSGLSATSYEKSWFEWAEPVAFLLHGNGINKESPLIENLGEGLKLSDNKDDESFINYENQQVVLNKLYPSDNGELLSGEGRDIPIRNVMNSTDNITFNTTLNDKTNDRRKKLFIVASGKNSEQKFSSNLITYLNNNINYNSVMRSMYYIGNCKFFDTEPIFSTGDLKGKTINQICRGMFYQTTLNPVRLRPVTTAGLSTRYDFGFERDVSGWKFRVVEYGQTNRLDNLEFTSITQQYPPASLPLPVRNSLESYESDIIDWKIVMPAENFDPYILKLQLIIKCDSESDFRTITFENWKTNYDPYTDLLQIMITSDLVDDNGDKLVLSKNYYITNLILMLNQDNSIRQVIDINNVAIDQDPYEAEITFRLFSDAEV